MQSKSPGYAVTCAGKRPVQPRISQPRILERGASSYVELVERERLKVCVCVCEIMRVASPAASQFQVSTS